MNLSLWFWVTWGALALSAVLGTIAYRRLVRALEDAVIVIFESGFVHSVNGKKGEVHLNGEKMNGAALVAARRVLACARAMHWRWYRRTLGEYIVRWTLDGFVKRDVL